MRAHLNQRLRKSALVPAAGLGSRLDLGPKAMLRLGDKSLLEILVDTLLPLVDELVIAVPPGFEREVASVLDDKVVIISGGNSRQESIENMLDACSGDIVLIQDAARPFASRALCQGVLQGAILHGAAGAFLDPAVPVGLIKEGEVGSCWSRDEAGVFQAPQAFLRDVLVNAQRGTAGSEFQSTAQMVMAAGYTLLAVPGEPENIKITTPLDWLVAQKVIAPKLGIKV